ncbi:MAG: hypothetical protein FJX77_04315 [Armatimonadetes bacterium]|nr:hypothetical protein [Armatimonadota bacterium]
MAVLRRLPPSHLLLIGLGLLSALVVLGQRFRVEAENRRVGLVLDYAQVRTLAVAAGLPLAGVLGQIRDAGATGVALSEETLRDLEQEGLVQFRLQPGRTPRAYRLRAADRRIGERLLRQFSLRLPGLTRQKPVGEHVVWTDPAGKPFYLAGRPDDYLSTVVGLDGEQVREVQAAGLSVVGRLSNYPGLTEAVLTAVLEDVRRQNIRVLIFNGEEVLGFRSLLRPAAAQVQAKELLYGSIEFGKQRGDESLTLALTEHLVRVHSISPAEMARMTPGEATERYVRAAEERNLRLHYVRLPVGAQREPLLESLGYLRRLGAELRAGGFVLGDPHPFRPVWTSSGAARGAAAGVALGVGAGAALLVAVLIPLSSVAQLGLGAGLAAAGAFAAAASIPLLTQGLALVAAVVFPTLALTLTPLPIGAYENHPYVPPVPRDGRLVSVVGEFALRCLVTLIGALLVAALLSELPYLVKARSFQGVKLATVAPLGLTALLYLTGPHAAYPTVSEEWDDVLARVRRLLGQPFVAWHLLAAGLGMVLLLLLVVRSGNDSGAAVSELELRFRAILDRVLYVRPRTKEFLVGHPALLLALALVSTPGRRTAALWLLLAGAIGQVGMLNSFCHLHSPLTLTVIRTANGLWTGLLVGGLLWGAWGLVVRPPRNRRRRALE